MDKFMSTFDPSQPCTFHYAEGGGYCSSFVCVCVCVIMPRAELLRHTVVVLSVSQSVSQSFCPLRISRHSLKTKR